MNPTNTPNQTYATTNNPVAPNQPPPPQLGPSVEGSKVIAQSGGRQLFQTKVKSNPNSTQNTLEIAEIREGVVIMNDGSFRSVIMVKSINFDLMSTGEQESVEYSYQGFLNSLYFPIQIFLKTQRVDLQAYIDKLDKIRTEQDNMLLAILMDDYLSYIDEISQQTNLMDKKFYIIIPYFPVDDVQKAIIDSKKFITGLVNLFNSNQHHVVINEQALEQAKTELKNRVQSVLAGLGQCNIQGLPLDTQELIELYYDTYNPDTATQQQLKNFDELSADIINKGQGPAPKINTGKDNGVA